MKFGKRSAHGFSMCLKKLESFSKKVHISSVGLTHNSGRSAAQMCLKVACVFEGGDPAR